MKKQNHEKKHYERTGIFLNINHATDKELMSALDAYVAEHCIRYGSAVRSLVMKALIAEGRIEKQKLLRVRN